MSHQICACFWCEPHWILHTKRSTFLMWAAYFIGFVIISVATTNIFKVKRNHHAICMFSENYRYLWRLKLVNWLIKMNFNWTKAHESKVLVILPWWELFNSWSFFFINTNFHELNFFYYSRIVMLKWIDCKNYNCLMLISCHMSNMANKIQIYNTSITNQQQTHGWCNIKEGK